MNPTIKKFFPKIKLISNKNNLGFAMANNQILKKIKSKYILINDNYDPLTEELLKLSVKEEPTNLSLRDYLGVPIAEIPDQAARGTGY